MNRKGCGRKRAWSISGTSPEFAWRGGGKPRKVSVKIAGLQAEITSIKDV
jgi:hypothetical protein